MDMTFGGQLTQVLPIDDPSEVGHARRTVQRMAEGLGFGASDAGRAALVATELCTNLLKHAGRGELHVNLLARPQGQGIELLALDRGPGFEVATCLADGYSTGATPGTGLGAVQRQAQVFDVHADEHGAAVLARLFAQADTTPDVRVGASHHALHGERACGDTWRVAVRGGEVTALVIDGLGHGEDAASAAQAGAQVFEQAPWQAPRVLLDEMHSAMGGTRGGALALAHYSQANGQLGFMGIGNIAGHLFGGGRSRGLASLPGIVGGQFRSAQLFQHPASADDLLLLCSDGLQTRWNLANYPGLQHRHPALIAAVLQRDFCRGRDDTTVLVIDLEMAHG